ncbi:MAG: hypothetical protein SFV17_08770 [Candidatus Obscuribacter sp.]|nr:hypothetical protein [Candidatus Obscuribacter sp.]
MNVYSVPRPRLGEVGLSSDGAYAYSRAPGRAPAFYELSGSLSLRLALEQEVEEQAIGAIAVAFRLTEAGCTHAAMLCSDQSTILFIDLVTGALVARASATGADATGICFAEGGRKLWVVGRDGYLLVVEIKQEQGRFMTDIAITASPLPVLVSSLQPVNALEDESRFLLTSEEGELLLLSREEGLYTLPFMTEESFEPLAMACDREGRTFAMLHGNGKTIFLWKNGYFNTVDIASADATPIGGGLIGLAASKDYDIICYSKSEIIGLTLEHDLALTPGSADAPSADAGDNLQLQVEPKLKLQILSSYHNNISAVVESPLSGRITALCS